MCKGKVMKIFSIQVFSNHSSGVFGFQQKLFAICDFAFIYSLRIASPRGARRQFERSKKWRASRAGAKLSGNLYLWNRQNMLHDSKKICLSLHSNDEMFSSPPLITRIGKIHYTNARGFVYCRNQRDKMIYKREMLITWSWMLVSLQTLFFKIKNHIFIHLHILINYEHLEYFLLLE